MQIPRRDQLAECLSQHRCHCWRENPKSLHISNEVIPLPHLSLKWHGLKTKSASCLPLCQCSRDRRWSLKRAVIKALVPAYVCRWVCLAVGISPVGSWTWKEILTGVKGPFYQWYSKCQPVCEQQRLRLCWLLAPFRSSLHHLGESSKYVSLYHLLKGRILWTAWSSFSILNNFSLPNCCPTKHTG